MLIKKQFFKKYRNIEGSTFSLFPSHSFSVCTVNSLVCVISDLFLHLYVNIYKYMYIDIERWISFHK